MAENIALKKSLLNIRSEIMDISKIETNCKGFDDRNLSVKNFPCSYISYIGNGYCNSTGILKNVSEKLQNDGYDFLLDYDRIKINDTKFLILYNKFEDITKVVVR